jgi:hypothetical protein
MSHAFDACFSPTELELAEILDRLEACLDEARIDFDGEVARLHSRDGVPTVLSMSTDSVASLGQVAKLAKSWWGVSLYCVSRPLAEVLGKSDAIEVYLRIFKVKAGRMIVYNEASGAFRTRAASDSMTNDLASLLVGICSALKCELVIYAEEAGDARIPDLAEIEQHILAQSRSQQALGWLAVIEERSLSFAKARELAGPWADQVRLSILGYVVFPFLTGTLGT